MTQAKLSQPCTLVHTLLTTAVLLCLTLVARAAIPVNSSGTGVLTFDSLPGNTSWSSRHVLPNSGTAITTVEGLDAPVQTNAASAINTALPTVAGGGANNNASWDSTNLRIQTRPTGNSYQLLMGQFQNSIGDDANQFTVSFNSAIVTPATGHAAGWRAFYSLSGQPGEWIVIPELSGFEPNGAISATVNLASNWLSGNILYLLFADDNADAITDPGYTIDNFQLTAAPVNVLPITITNQPTNLTVGERGAATFTVGASGAPLSFHWLSNGVAIPGANSATHAIPSAHFSANGAIFSCIVSNLISSQTSVGATLTVTADAVAPAAVIASASTNNIDVMVTFSEPILHPEGSSFTVFPTDTDPDVTGISGFSAVVNGNVATVTLESALTDGVNYSIRIYDIYDTSVGVPGGNLIAPYPTFIPVRRDLLLIDLDGPNNVWKYSIETNLFGTGWETTGYDDSDPVAWPSGAAALGVNTDANGNSVQLRTTTAYPASSSAPQFFRRHFFLPASATGATLAIRHLFEDGAVVFINGQEAGRFNVATGVLSVATRAVANFTENSPLPAPAPLLTTGLVAGDNVIAVVVFQSGANSTDSIMALELLANIGTYAAGPPSIVTQPANQSANEGANVGLSVVADGALPLTYQWSRNGAPITGATNATYNIVGVLPSQAGNYTVLVGNNLGTSNSAIAALTVSADTTAPAFVSAVGDVNLTNITLTITDAFGLNQAAAETEANYSVTGPNTLTIESAVLINPTTVRLTTSPRTPFQNYTVILNGIVDRSEAANAATPLSRPVQATIVLFGYNQVWRYDESGNDLGTTWKDVGYNDSSWLSGAGFLAFETTDTVLTLFTNLAGGSGTNTPLSLTNQTLGGIGGTNVTFYFRTTVSSLPFNPSTPGNVIRAVSYFDDGGVIYVNGSEQVRFNLTNSPVALNYTNLAVAGSTEGSGGLITSNLLGFVQGNNVIAAEVHQNAMNSSDIAWGMQLEALVTTFSSSGPTLKISYSGGNVAVTWSGGGTLQHSTDISSPANWNNVPGSPTSPYTTSATGPFRFYRVVQP